MFVKEIYLYKGVKIRLQPTRDLCPPLIWGPTYCLGLPAWAYVAEWKW